jgi:hypothetical protein
MIKMIPLKWPYHSLRAVPSLEEARHLATIVREAVMGRRQNDSTRMNLKRACAIARINVRRGRIKNPEIQTLLTPIKDGSFDLIVDLQEDPKRTKWGDIITERRRTRFRISHEIGHLWFYDYKSVPYGRFFTVNEEEERFCDRFASHLLVPPTSDLLLQADPRALRQVSNIFDVSLEVAGEALKLVDPTLWILLFSRRNTSNDKGVKIRLDKCYTPEGARLIDGKHIDSEILNKALAIGYCEGCETIKEGQFKGSYYMKALRCGQKEQLLTVWKPLLITGDKLLPESRTS